jgi:diaminopimelate decarboxylase
MAVTGASLSHIYPRGSRLNERGVLELGGCDARELAREFGTPAYVFVEDDLRARARAFLEAGEAALAQEDQAAQNTELAVVYASKACSCTAVLRVFAEEGLWCDVASGGELHMALAAGFPVKRLVMHGNAKSRAELRAALDVRVGLIVIDNFNEIDRLAELLHERAQADAPQPVLLRATPDVRGDTHEKISTGQANSKFGFSMNQITQAIARVNEIAGLQLCGLHAHVGSQLLDLAPFHRAAQQLAPLGPFPVWDLGGGLGVAYTAAQPPPPSIAQYVHAVVQAAHGQLGSHARLMIEPGRSLTANAGVTLYTVESVKRNVSTWVAVDGGMSDNLRPMLYDARYEAHIVDRPDGTQPCILAGKHCESGDVIVREALLHDPQPGDVVVTPATGAYGHAMANNYNGVPRPPVVFCKDGNARLVQRRERFEELTARDVS